MRTACGPIAMGLTATMLYDDVFAECEEGDVTYQPMPRFIEWEPDVVLVTVPRLTLKQAGWRRIKYPVLRISAKTYVDTKTGEIIKKRDMFKFHYPVPHNPGLRLIEQLRVVNKLGKKARELCVFLLKMRNNRGSFVLTLSDLLDGYINRNGVVKRMSRARLQHAELIGQIASVGVIANEQALGSLFQKHATNTPRLVLEESHIWYGWSGIFSGKSLWSPGVSDS
jgi:hypothetical protein